jgi:hypothetical protein
MIDETRVGRTLDRRGFLKGSAFFAALLGAAVAAPAFAQEPQNKPAPEGEKPADKTDQPTPAKKKPLLDKEGREYRVCDMCGGNMYKQDNTWTCEQCGYSYQE